MADDPRMDDGERGRFPVLSTRVIVVARVVVGLAAVLSLTVLLWAFGRGTDQNKTQLGAVRTAASIALGAGGAAALLTGGPATANCRTGRSRHPPRRQRAAHHRPVHQSRRPTRLGQGPRPLSRLVRLGTSRQDNHDHRQTIVNVICAYLRMPYTPPADSTQTPDTSTDATEASSGRAAETAELRQEREQQEQEKQVRLTATAQRPKYWPEIDLDLANATLLDFQLSWCHLHRGGFDGAQFSEHAGFDNTQFAHGANLEDARAQVDVNDAVRRLWPDGWVVQPPASPEDGQLPEQKGRWGFLVHAAADADQMH